VCVAILVSGLGGGVIGAAFAGQKGLPGAPGPAGPQGLQGETGATGAPGSSGTTPGLVLGLAGCGTMSVVGTLNDILLPDSQDAPPTLYRTYYVCNPSVPFLAPTPAATATFP
jgi:hypothetical protein